MSTVQITCSRIHISSDRNGREKMDREVRFGEILEKLKRDAATNGFFTTSEEIESRFAELKLAEDQLDQVRNYLISKGIAIDEEAADITLTGEDGSYLHLYLEELEDLPDATDSEKLAYAIGAMAGDVSAQRNLIQSYLKDVPQIAKLYSDQGVPLEDLIGEGNVALSVGAGMLGSQEKPEDCEGMLMKMVMDAMEELVQEDLEWLTRTVIKGDDTEGGDDATDEEIAQAALDEDSDKE